MQTVEEPDIERDDLYLLLDSAAMQALQIILPATVNYPGLLYRGTLLHESTSEYSPVTCTASRGSILMWQNQALATGSCCWKARRASMIWRNHLRSLLQRQIALR